MVSVLYTYAKTVPYEKCCFGNGKEIMENSKVTQFGFSGVAHYQFQHYGLKYFSH